MPGTGQGMESTAKVPEKNVCVDAIILCHDWDGGGDKVYTVGKSNWI